MYRLGILLFLLQGTTPTEKHAFRVRADVTYRCYGGHGAKKASDSRTHVVCDNQTYQKTLLDQTVTLVIEDTPDPENSKDLEGLWEGAVDFRGRKFTLALTLLKHVPGSAGRLSERPYRLRAVALDDEPVTRQSAVFESADLVSAFSPLELQYSSRGQPEEIELRVSLVPSEAR